MNQHIFIGKLKYHHGFGYWAEFYSLGELKVWVGHKQVVIIKDDIASLIETTTHGGLQDFTKAYETIEELIK
jgi:hypothetical protein